MTHLSSNGPVESASPADPALEDRIQRIVAGLPPPVIVAGEPADRLGLAARMAALHVPGVSVAVIHEGRLAWTRGFGDATVGGSPVTAGTLFQAASISKPITALAVLKLVQDGRLRLDTDVDSRLVSWHLPPAAGSTAVDVRGLLNHSAGLTVHGFAGYPAGQPVPTLAQVLDGIDPANSPPIRVGQPPGTAWRYSGGGYTVLQQLLIDVTGEAFPVHMERAVLGPLAMAGSTFAQPLPVERIAEAATPYDFDGKPVEGGPHIYPEMAAAGLWSTPSDLARVIMALQRAWSGWCDEVLSPDMVKTMLTPGLGGFGLGFGLAGGGKGGGPQPCFFHSGLNAGFSCVMAGCMGGSQDGAVIMTNGSAGAVAHGLLRAIAEEYDWPEFRPVERRLGLADPARYARLAGRYRMPDFEIAVIADSNRLYGRVGSDQVELFPLAGTDEFFLKVDVSTVAFHMPDAGPATALVVRSANTDQTGLRADVPSAA
ncbi:serine hydrolase [Azospirillum melinis]|uniref:Serine hydrolase n=1 Tax=Azospirillum melinis TaxID=328839 RepID=A0ABX2KKM7_9PROT|nr:serine hydrolase [Azospirillum melinis]MBP2307125.1 CubicO group peptidase (beta-lactamase class C family) [Azospirillum melinis]NUB04170.1 serine hydrolase [Azospirillum melinis]